MQHFKRWYPLFGALLLSPLAHGAGPEMRQNPAAIATAAQRFVEAQLAGTPGEVIVSVASPDHRLNLPACEALEPFQSAGSRLWGQTSVGVRCQKPRAWSLYLPVSVSVRGQVVVAARAIGAREEIKPEDLRIDIQDLTRFSGTPMTQTELVVGRTLERNIAMGEPLRAEMLRAQVAIKQGQSVVVIARGSGFSVSQEGRALNNAAVGQVVGVKTQSGMTVRGMAALNGAVEVVF